MLCPTPMSWPGPMPMPCAAVLACPDAIPFADAMACPDAMACTDGMALSVAMPCANAMVWPDGMASGQAMPSAQGMAPRHAMASAHGAASWQAIASPNGQAVARHGQARASAQGTASGHAMASEQGTASGHSMAPGQAMVPIDGIGVRHNIGGTAEGWTSTHGWHRRMAWHRRSSRCACRNESICVCILRARGLQAIEMEPAPQARLPTQVRPQLVRRTAGPGARTTHVVASSQNVSWAKIMGVARSMASMQGISPEHSVPTAHRMASLFEFINYVTVPAPFNTVGLGGDGGWMVGGKRVREGGKSRSMWPSAMRVTFHNSAMHEGYFGKVHECGRLGGFERGPGGRGKGGRTSTI